MSLPRQPAGAAAVEGRRLAALGVRDARPPVQCRRLEEAA